MEEYHKEMELTLLRAQIREREEATIARFLHRLNREIQDIVELLGTLVHQEVKVEMQLKMRSASKRSTANSNKEKVRSDRSSKKRSDPFQVCKEMIVTPTPRMSSIKCFKCLGKGHIASQCLNKRAMILRNNGEIKSDSSRGDISTSSDLQSCSDDSHGEGDLLMVKRLMGSQVIEEVETQRENIFHSRCHVLGNLYSIIIDGGSCMNVASERLVSKLALTTILHLRPSSRVDQGQQRSLSRDEVVP
ncbi:hypothetical protein CR513_16536, partial [Mucuna pruriens]